jgi:hypothetical protein
VKSPKEMSDRELEFELSQASDWFAQHGSTLPRDQQDKISNQINELEVEFNRRKKKEQP